MNFPVDMKGREGEIGFPPVPNLKGRRVSPPAPASPQQSGLPSRAHLPSGTHRWASDRQLLPPFSRRHRDGVLPDSAWARALVSSSLARLPGPLHCLSLGGPENSCLSRTDNLLASDTCGAQPEKTLWQIRPSTNREGPFRAIGSAVVPRPCVLSTDMVPSTHATVMSRPQHRREGCCFQCAFPRKLLGLLSPSSSRAVFAGGEAQGVLSRAGELPTVVGPCPCDSPGEGNGNPLQCFFSGKSHG